jgi:hypothetical protein
VQRQKLPHLGRRAVTRHCGWSARFHRRGHQRDPTRQLWRIEKVNPLVAAEEMSARDPASDCVRPHSGSVERLTCDDTVVCRRQPLDQQVRLRPAPHPTAPLTGQFPRLIAIPPVRRNFQHSSGRSPRVQDPAPSRGAILQPSETVTVMLEFARRRGTSGTKNCAPPPDRRGFRQSCYKPSERAMISRWISLVPP